MRIVSLLPSATEIVFAIGRGGDLVGVAEGSDHPPGARGIPVVTRSGALDQETLEAVEPDLVIAPDTGRRRSPGPPGFSDAALQAGRDATVLRLGPTSVEGILNSIQAIGAMTESEDAAMFVVEGLRERLQAVEEIVVGRRDHGFQPPRVAAIGSLEPLMTTGFWVPEQVRLAGGWELLGNDGGAPTGTTWASIAEVDPEIVVLMPRGLDLPGAIGAWARLERPAGWPELRAVHEGRTFAVDGRGLFERPGPRVIDGIEVLTELIDPVAFDGMSPPGSWERVD
jgi:iron complex transport system substrate-binding protein